MILILPAGIAIIGNIVIVCMIAIIVATVLIPNIVSTVIRASQVISGVHATQGLLVRLGVNASIMSDPHNMCDTLH